MSKKLIEQSVDILRSEKGFFACWSKATYGSDQGHKFVRLDKVFLNLMFLDDDGNPVYRRISACRQLLPTGCPVQTYALEQTYRITSGPRKGCVVPWYEVNGDEFWQPAGISRRMAYEPAPDAFHEYHQNDGRVFDLLKLLPKFEQRTTLLAGLPVLLHSYRPDQHQDLRLRKTGSALRWMRTWAPGASASREAELALRQHHRMKAEDAGNGRLALPYAYVHGRGIVVAVDDESGDFNQWVRVPDISASIHNLEVCHELADVFCNAERATG
jgi:hypothetical protein